MRMRVHESRRQGRVAEIDHLCAIRNREVAANIDNFVALDDDDSVLHERFRFPIEHAFGFERDHFIGRISARLRDIRKLQQGET